MRPRTSELLSLHGLTRRLVRAATKKRPWAMPAHIRTPYQPYQRLDEEEAFSLPLSGRGSMDTGPPCWNSRRAQFRGPSKGCEFRGEHAVRSVWSACTAGAWTSTRSSKRSGTACRRRGSRPRPAALFRFRNSQELETELSQGPNGALQASGYGEPLRGCCKEQVKELQRTLKEPDN